MKQERIIRLHTLAKTKKDRPFTAEEHTEYEGLKLEYVASIKQNLQNQLENAGIPKKDK